MFKKFAALVKPYQQLHRPGDPKLVPILSAFSHQIDTMQNRLVHITVNDIEQQVLAVANEPARSNRAVNRV